jgi:hypothetical protein
MSLDQVQKFVEISMNYTWDKIGIMGGELTTHPDLDGVFKILKQYKDIYPHCQVWCMTNGIIEYQFPPWVEVVYNRDHSQHHAFYVSPTDEKFCMDKRACHVLYDCGMGYSIYGFTPCCNNSVAIRALRLVDGIQELKNVTYESLMKLCNIYCKHCGWYMMDDFDTGHLLSYPIDYMSLTWQMACARYNQII